MALCRHRPDQVQVADVIADSSTSSPARRTRACSRPRQSQAGHPQSGNLPVRPSPARAVPPAVSSPGPRVRAAGCHVLADRVCDADG